MTAPYRTPPTSAPVDRSWRRWLVDSFATLRDSLWWRRWAGGRWAKYRCVYNATGERGIRVVFTLADLAVEAAHGPDAEMGVGYALRLLDDRWRRVAECPHEAMAFAVVAPDRFVVIERRRVPCDCEVWPPRGGGD